MSPYEYLSRIIDNLDLMLCLVLLFSLPYLWLIRKVSVSIFDPMMIVFIGDWMGTSLVFFMWLMLDISDQYFYYYGLSQIAFISGIFLFKPRLRVRCNVNEGSTQLPYLIFIVSSILQILTTVAIWIMKGIPLFQVSRLGAFVGSGGFGIIQRIQGGSSFFAVFAACYIFWSLRSTPARKRVAILFFIWLFLCGLLSGSKSSFFPILEIAFVYLFLFKPNYLGKDIFWGGPKGKWLMTLAVIAAFLVILIQSQGDLLNVLSAMAFRLISFGDIYIYAYPFDTISLIKGDNAFMAMFGGILSTFRVIPQDIIYQNMGLQFTSIIFPDIDYFAGPNPRHAVFGFHYFGWFGLIFSFLLGALLIKLQGFLFYPKRLNFYIALAFGNIYFSLIALQSDFDLGMTNMADTIIGTVLVLMISLPIYYSINEKN